MAIGIAALSRPVPTCGLCHQHHPGQECPLLNKSSTINVSISGGMPDLSVEVEPPTPENASPVDTNNCSDNIAEVLIKPYTYQQAA